LICARTHAHIHSRTHKVVLFTSGLERYIAIVLVFSFFFTPPFENVGKISTKSSSLPFVFISPKVLQVESFFLCSPRPRSCGLPRNSQGRPNKVAQSHTRKHPHTPTYPYNNNNKFLFILVSSCPLLSVFVFVVCISVCLSVCDFSYSKVKLKSIVSIFRVPPSLLHHPSFNLTSPSIHIHILTSSHPRLRISVDENIPTQLFHFVAVN